MPENQKHVWCPLCSNELPNDDLWSTAKNKMLSELYRRTSEIAKSENDSFEATEQMRRNIETILKYR